MNSYEIVKRNMVYSIIISAIAVLCICGTAVLGYRNNNTDQTVSNVWLGVETVEVDEAIRARYDIKSPKGLLVSRTFVGSPAEVAGIKNGDVIRRWNGVSVISQQQFQGLIGNAGADQKIKLTIDRQQQQLLMYVTLGIRPGSF